MKEFLEYLLKNICLHKDKIKIEEKAEGSYITYNITADEEDKGKIIGKDGKTIKAIRILLSVLAKKDKKNVGLKIT